MLTLKTQPQTEASHAMPVFGKSLQGLDPDTAFAMGFIVGFGPMRGSDPIQDLLIHTPAKTAFLFACGTVGGRGQGLPSLALARGAS
jgi:hypothetical protein